MEKLFVCLGLAFLLVAAGATVGSSAVLKPGTGTWTGTGWSLGQGTDSTQSKPKTVSFTINIQDPRGNMVKGSVTVTNPSDPTKVETYDFTGIVKGRTINIAGNTSEEWPLSQIIIGMGTTTVTQDWKVITFEFLQPDKASISVKVTKQ